MKKKAGKQAPVEQHEICVGRDEKDHRLIGERGSD